MGISNKIKSKILNSSDSYNHYKKESAILSKDLNKQIKTLNNEINTYKKNYDKLNREFNAYKKKSDKILDSNRFLLNTILLDYDLKPIGERKLINDLDTEMLEFIYHVCKKHELEFWLDWGSALGAIRHEGFIPFDDDVDIGMMRKDFIKFNEIIKDELKLHNLDNMIYVIFNEFPSERWVNYFTKLTIFIKDTIFATVDIFPYDYISVVPEDVKKTYKEIENSYHKKILEGFDEKQVLDEIYQKYNFSLDPQKYIFPCIHLSGVIRKFELLDSDIIFPLKLVKFHNKYLPAANNLKLYAINKYGEKFGEIPMTVATHNHVERIKKIDDNEELSINCINRLKEVNKNFNNK